MIAGIGIGRVRGRVATTEDALVAAAEDLGFPVVLKAVGPAIVHKTELGAVRVGLASPDALREAWRELRARLGDRMTAGLVQEMAPKGVEMLVGMVEHGMFGPVVACAFGGTLTEVLADSQFRLHPVTDVEANDMVAGLRGARLLAGYRGSHPADSVELARTIERVSALITLAPEIRELDINPLVVHEHGVQALDARIRIGEARVSAPAPGR